MPRCTRPEARHTELRGLLMFLIVECEVGGMLEEQVADHHRLWVPDFEMGFHVVKATV